LFAAAASETQLTLKCGHAWIDDCFRMTETSVRNTSSTYCHCTEDLCNSAPITIYFTFSRRRWWNLPSSRLRWWKSDGRTVFSLYLFHSGLLALVAARFHSDWLRRPPTWKTITTTQALFCLAVWRCCYYWSLLAFDRIQFRAQIQLNHLALPWIERQTTRRPTRHKTRL